MIEKNLIALKILGNRINYEGERVDRAIKREISRRKIASVDLGGNSHDRASFFIRDVERDSEKRERDEKT